MVIGQKRQASEEGEISFDKEKEKTRWIIWRRRFGEHTKVQDLKGPCTAAWGLNMGSVESAKLC